MIEPEQGASHRLNCTLSAGTIDYSAAEGVAAYDYGAPTFSSTGGYFDRGTVGGALGDAATFSSAVFTDGKEGGCLITFAGLINGTSPTITSYSVSVMRSTDNGATWTAIKTASAPFNLALAYASTPALYRLDCRMVIASNTNSPPNVLRSGGLSWNVDYHGIYDHLFPNLVVHFGRSYDDAYFLAASTPLPDSALAGDLTLYKVCAGNTFAKLIVPAAAKRFKGPRFGMAHEHLRGNYRDVRAEYADVVSLVDGSGNAVAQAASQFDPGTIYKPGTRVTYGDPTGGLWSGDLSCTAFPLGIYGYSMLIEAARGPCISRDAQGNPSPVINYAALGV